jgi:probable rRNA maturation factor
MWKYILDNENLKISYTVKTAPKINGVFLTEMKNEILGSNYELSIYFVGSDMMKKVNKKYRDKDSATDILSFPFGNDGFGEIYMCPEQIDIKAEKFGTTSKKYLDYLFMHGMVHLLGHDHGDKMDSLERRYSKKLNIYYPY